MTFTREERVKLLRAGFTGGEIVALYVILNGFEIVGVNWQDGAVTKLAGMALELRSTPSENSVASFIHHPLQRESGSVLMSLTEG